MIYLFVSECMMNGSCYRSQLDQFKDFLLRVNKYNCLQMVGDATTMDRKLILVEVCNDD